jgi:serine/threonine protein kinase
MYPRVKAAVDRRSNKRVAIKILSKSKRPRQDLEKEISFLNSILGLFFLNWRPHTLLTLKRRFFRLRKRS